MPKYKTIDLFVGIGGIRLGFDQAFVDEKTTYLILYYSPLDFFVFICYN
ncbi:MAG: hypothetical protein LBM93_01835 [Oscillospiraceae bacterium]|nr:hypothetical protein [Oscillospiraceae bacterium]